MTDAKTISPPHDRSRAVLFPHRHLLGIAGLYPHHIDYVLDEAEQWVTMNRQATKHDDRLAGLTIINAFF